MRSNLQAPVLSSHVPPYQSRTLCIEASVLLELSSSTQLTQLLPSITAVMARKFFVGGNFKMFVAQGPLNLLRHESTNIGPAQERL